MTGWKIRRFTESVSAFHDRVVPDDVGREIWISCPPEPGLALGSAQGTDAVDLAATQAAGIEVCRRRSGGGAVLVVPDEMVWIDVILPADDRLWQTDVGASFAWLGAVWATVTARKGQIAPAVYAGPMQKSQWSSLVCFAGLGAGEVTIGEQKLVGISQRRTRYAARFQCAVHVAFDSRALPALLALDHGDRTAVAEALGNGVATVDLAPETLVERFILSLPR